MLVSSAGMNALCAQTLPTFLFIHEAPVFITVKALTTTILLLTLDLAEFITKAYGIHVGRNQSNAIKL